MLVNVIFECGMMGLTLKIESVDHGSREMTLIAELSVSNYP
jgi:hypothetical protein